VRSTVGAIYDLLGHAHPFLVVPHDGMKFSTPTVEYDIHGTVNCAAMNGAGWWYNKCGLFIPTSMTYPSWYGLPSAAYDDIVNVRGMVKLQ